MHLKSSTTLCLFYIFIGLLPLLLSQVFVYLYNSFIILKSNKRIHLAHSSVTCQKKKSSRERGCFCSTYAANSPSESATLLLCLRPLYDFCNEITVCFPDQWVLLIVLATFLFPIQGVLYIVCISRAAALTRASTCEAKMLISQTVPIGIMPRSASGEG